MGIERKFKKNQGATSIEYGMIASIALSVVALSAMVYGGYIGVLALQKYVNKPTEQRANVGFGDKAELFMEKDGKKFYAEIDGMPIQEYLEQRKEK